MTSIELEKHAIHSDEDVEMKSECTDETSTKSEVHTDQKTANSKSNLLKTSKKRKTSSRSPSPSAAHSQTLAEGYLFVYFLPVLSLILIAATFCCSFFRSVFFQTTLLQSCDPHLSHSVAVAC
jgi:hypothetical protein